MSAKHIQAALPKSMVIGCIGNALICQFACIKNKFL